MFLYYIFVTTERPIARPIQTTMLTHQLTPAHTNICSFLHVSGFHNKRPVWLRIISDDILLPCHPSGKVVLATSD